MSIGKRLALVFVAAVVHFPIQIAALWQSAIDVFPGDPPSYAVQFYVWNTISGILSFPFLTFGFNLPVQPLEQFCDAHAPTSYLALGLLNSILWGVVAMFTVERVRRKRRNWDNQAPEAIGAAAAPQPQR